MSDETLKSRSTAPISKMGDFHCEHMDYEMEIPLDKFDLQGFKREIGAPKEEKREQRVCNTGDPVRSDYHVHFTWQLLEKNAAVEFDLAYIAKVTKRRSDEKEPFAENVMQWLAQFLSFPDVSARISTNFIYRDKRRLVAFPLPIKTVLPDLGAEAEINGITFGLPSQPSGFQRVYVTQKPESIVLTLQLERRLVLGSFSLSEQLRIASAFAEKLVQ